VAGRANEWTETTFEELENYRRARGLSRLKLASVIGISNSCYHNWQRGLNAPNLNTQHRIRRLLDEPVFAPVGRFVGYPSGLPPTTADVRARRADAVAQALGLSAGALGTGGALVTEIPTPAPPPRNPRGRGRRSSPSLKTEPTSAPGTGMSTTVDDPWASLGKPYSHPGAEHEVGFRLATDDHIRSVLVRLTSAALAAGMDLPPTDLPTFIRDLRRALT
jgi:DNA-binding XRE family transcriptional regulator